jgi:hypothetical protein
MTRIEARLRGLADGDARRPKRSAQNRGPFQLNVTARWTVSRTGSGGGPFGLPDGVIGNPAPVTVREIQSVSR